MLVCVVCARACVCARARVWVCGTERERERERQTDRQRKRERERERERERGGGVGGCDCKPTSIISANNGICFLFQQSSLLMFFVSCDDHNRHLSSINHCCGCTQLKSPQNGPVRGVVVLAGASATHELLLTLDSEVSYVSLVLSETVALQADTLMTAPSGAGGTLQVIDLAAGALVTSPPYVHVPEFLPLWNDVWGNRSRFLAQVEKIPWLGQYYTQVTQCDVGDVACWNQAAGTRNALEIEEGQGLGLYPAYQVKAVAVMATLLKRLHTALCGSTSGVCPDLKTQLSQRDFDEMTRMLRQSAVDFSQFSSLSPAFAGMSDVIFNSSNGDAATDGREASYSVLNFRKDGPDVYNFKQVR